MNPSGKMSRKAFRVGKQKVSDFYWKSFMEGGKIS